MSAAGEERNAEIVQLRARVADLEAKIERTRDERDAAIARAERAEYEARSWEQQARLKY